MSWNTFTKVNETLHFLQWKRYKLVTSLSSSSSPSLSFGPIGQDALRNDLTPSILVRKAARSAPEALTISPRAPKISNKEPERARKTYDSQDNFLWTNDKISCSFPTFQTKTENVWLSAVGEIIFPAIKGKQTSACLEIRFWDFRWSAVEVWALNWRRHFVSFWTNGGSLP